MNTTKNTILTERNTVESAELVRAVENFANDVESSLEELA